MSKMKEFASNTYGELTVESLREAKKQLEKNDLFNLWKVIPYGWNVTILEPGVDYSNKICTCGMDSVYGRNNEIHAEYCDKYKGNK